MSIFNSVSKKCGVCGKIYLVQPARLKAGRGKYCSPACYFKSKKGKPSWNKGLPAPWVTGTNSRWYKKGKPKCKVCGVNISYTMTYCKKHANEGERNHGWKGGDASYSAIHHWVSHKLGKPDTCEKCGTKATGREIHWSNKDHKYKRVVEDWRRLCVACHIEYDKQMGLKH